LSVNILIVGYFNILDSINNWVKNGFVNKYHIIQSTILSIDCRSNVFLYIGTISYIRARTLSLCCKLSVYRRSGGRVVLDINILNSEFRFFFTIKSTNIGVGKFTYANRPSPLLTTTRSTISRQSSRRWYYHIILPIPTYNAYTGRGGRDKGWWQQNAGKAKRNEINFSAMPHAQTNYL